MQCQGLTREGQQCSRDAVTETNFCYQHQNQPRAQIGGVGKKKQARLARAAAPSQPQSQPHLKGQTLVDYKVHRQQISNFYAERDNLLRRMAARNIANAPYTPQTQPVPPAWTPAEDKVNRYLSDLIRGYNTETRSEHHYLARTYFPMAKRQYEHNSVFTLLDTMPKGGLLHVHSGALTTYEWNASTGFFSPTEDWYVDSRMLSGDIYAPIVPGNKTFVYSPQGPPSGPYWQRLSREFANRPAIRKRLHDCLTIGASLAGSESATAWAAFEVVNTRWSDLRSNPDYASAFYTAGFESQAQHGIQHVDVRLAFGAYADAKKAIDIMLASLQEANQHLSVPGSSYQVITAKVILSCPRTKSPPEVLANLEDAYRLKKEYPHFVKGYDLIAQEDPFHGTLFYYDEVWSRVPELEAKYGPGITLPFYFHDGETDRIQNRNVIDAILLNTKRIGHGFNAYFFPTIREELKKRDICLEVCPISNQMLGYFSDLRIHPANSFIHDGVPMVIANDDPLMYDYCGLTYDFCVATLAWNLDLKIVKRLVYNSIWYSCLEPEERAVAIQRLNTAWQRWITDTMRRYSLV